MIFSRDSGRGSICKRMMPTRQMKRIDRQVKGWRESEAAEGHAAYRKLVQDTGGIWMRGDALRYQEEIRSEWGKSSC